MNQHRILTYDEISKNDFQRIGGKARNLYYLSCHKLPVPKWAVIPTEHYDHYKAGCLPEIEKLLSRLKNFDPDTIEKVSRQIKSILATSRLSENLLAELESRISVSQKTKFAVRSSCSMEDLATLSFAGLYDSYLNIQPDNLAQYIKKCWDSVFNTGSLSYLIKNKLSPLKLSMAVIIQEMIEAEKSGVMFQTNPAGKLDETAIVAGYGLGEGIVNGETETDSFFYNRFSKEIKSQIRVKNKLLAYDVQAESGLKKINVPEHLKKDPVLNEKEVLKLIDLSQAISYVYNDFQDIEWAFNPEGEVFLLQSRPITTLPQGSLDLYDNTNIVESYPGISSPMTVSLVKKVYHNMFYYAFLKSGYSKSVLKPYIPYFSLMVDNIEGRIYYNMSNWYRVMSILPFASSLFIPSLEDAIGAKRSQVRFKKSYTLWWNKTRVFISFIIRFFRINRHLRKYDRNFSKIYEKARKNVKNESDSKKLAGILRQFANDIFPVIQFGRVSDTYLMIVLTLTKKFFISLGLNKDESQNLINGLLVGEEGIDSLAPVQSIKKMIDILLKENKIKEILQNASNWQELQERLAPYPDFLSLINLHLDLYGDRTIGELKFETKTYRQNPMNLAHLILKQYQNIEHLKKMSEIEKNLRQEAVHKLENLLITSKKIKKGNFLIKSLRKFVRIREKVRFNRSRYYGVFREIILKIGENWEREGLLKNQDDIFFLTDDEMCLQVQNPDPKLIHQTIDSRKKEWAEYENRKPENRMWLKGAVSENKIPQIETKNNGILKDQETISGTGCCPGIVKAKASVLKYPDEKANVKDKIIVAENTDPGWVFLIMEAKGLIVEKGSLLSHTAIIGREMGIPTIVGADNAVSLIPDQAIIEMDGSNGTVKIINNQ